MDSNDDIIVLNASNVFNEVLLGRVSAMQYIVNEIQYDMGYYLVDKIYPDFTTFVKTISMSQGEKGKLFAQRQESTRNDVKHACHLEFSNPDLQLYWFNTFMRCS